MTKEEMLQRVQKWGTVDPLPIVIHAPIWKTMSVGIDEKKIKCVNIVRIDYVNRHGDRLFPFDYRVDGEKLFGCPAQRIGSVTLRIIPISEMKVISSMTTSN